MGGVLDGPPDRDVTVIIRLWLDPSATTVRGRVLIPTRHTNQVVSDEREVIEQIAAIVRSLERGDDPCGSGP